MMLAYLRCLVLNCLVLTISAGEAWLDPKFDEILRQLTDKSKALKREAEDTYGFASHEAFLANLVAKETVSDARHALYVNPSKFDYTLSDYLYDRYIHHKRRKEADVRAEPLGGNKVTARFREKAEKMFLTAYHQVKNMPDRTVMKLVKVFTQRGRTSYNCEIGPIYRMGSKTIDSSLLAAITISAEQNMRSITDGLPAHIGADLLSSFNGGASARRDLLINIDLQKTVYIYQVVGDFTSKPHSRIVIHGNCLTFTKPIEAYKKVSASWKPLPVNTDGPDKGALDQLLNKILALKQEADRHYTVNTENKLIQEAVSDAVHRAREAKKSDRLLMFLQECYQYHEAKENQYRKWGNLKPAYYHQKSKEHFKDAEAKLMENLKNSMEELHELLNKRREDKENRHPLDMRPDYYY